MSELIGGDDNQGGKAWTSNKIEFQMTADHDLLAKIDEIYKEAQVDFGGLIIEDDIESIFRSLRAVVVREPLLRSPFDNESNDEAQRVGYNQCLADVKADIAKELE